MKNHRATRVRLGWWALLCGYIGQIGVGLSAAFAYEGGLWAWHRQRLARELWDLGEVPHQAIPLMRQLTAMLGATIACWALAMVFLVLVPLRRRERWAWWCIAASTALWFVVDTGLSASHAATTNVLFNCAAAIMIAVPLAMVWPALAPAAPSTP